MEFDRFEATATVWAASEGHEVVAPRIMPHSLPGAIAKMLACRAGK